MPAPLNAPLTPLLRFARRFVVAVVGTTILVIGVAMLVLPGPAFVVIPVGLGILAIEFAWARRLLDRLRKEGKKALPKRLQSWFGADENDEAEKSRKAS